MSEDGEAVGPTTGGPGSPPNARLAAAAFIDDHLRLSIALRGGLRGADRAELLVRDAGGAPTSIRMAANGLIAAAEGQLVAQFCVPVAALAALDDPDATTVMVRSLSIELGEARRARIAWPDAGLPCERHVHGRTIALVQRDNGDAALAMFRRRVVPPPCPPATGPQLKVLVYTGTLAGEHGVTKALIQIGAAIAAAGHQASVVTLAPNNDPLPFALPPGIGLDHVVHPFGGAPGGMGTAAESDDLDPRVAAYLRQTDADLVLCTAPRCALFRAVLPARTTLLLSDHDGRRIDLIANNECDHVYLAALAACDAVHVVDPLIAAATRRVTDRPVAAIGNVVHQGPPATDRSSIFATRRIVAVGRLVAVKRMHHIIDAFARVAKALPDWSLDIFGTGPEEEALQARLAERGLTGRAALRGFDREVGAILAGGAVLVSASRVESFGLAMAEAMAAGCPVIAYDQPVGARTLLRDGGGILVPFGRKRQLADAMLALCRQIEARDERVLAMTAKAAETVRAYTPDRISEQWGALIASLPIVRPGFPAGRATPPAT